jgi:DNA-binding SARP family transcriptional activator
MRAMTAERYFEFCLAAGRHALVLPELIQYAGDNPLRERAVNYLMIALIRSGQQHEAYAAYQRLALRLDTDLGIQPGLEIRRTLHDILDGHRDIKRPPTTPDYSVSIAASA